MICRSRYLWAIILALWSGAVALAEPAQERFAEAQRLFDAAKAQLEKESGDSLDARRQFHESARAFAALTQDGVSGVNLCVNAGNAYHFAGDDARALLWYLRAEHLANTPETRAGLATLRRVCKGDLWPAERTSIVRLLMFWHYDLGQRGKQIILLACYPLGCLLMIVRLFISRRPMWRWLGVTLVVIGGVMGISDVAASTAPGPAWAVVLEPARGYAGDGEGYSIIAESIAPGQEVRLIESRPQWVRIELPSQVRCWVPAEACEKV